MRTDPVHLRRLANFLPALLLAFACSEDRPSTPTDPGGGVSATPSAIVTGDVVREGRPAADVEVRVDGSSSMARTDGGGRFRLDGVGAGDRVLLFVHSGAQAPLSLADVRPGERIELSVALAGSNARLRSISRGAPNGQGTLRLDVSPDSWNTNWSRSSGTVTVFLKGGDFALVDPASVVLVGDDPLELPLVPRSSRIEGNHVRATFAKADALDLLLEPILTGQTRTVSVQFLLGGATVEMDATIRVVGPGQ